MQALFEWILAHTHLLTSKLNIHSLALVRYLSSKYLCAVWHAAKKTKTKQNKKISQRLNRLVSKINDKMGAQALFSRSHLNISFRGIDLFCVTYPDPFFVIKRERVGLWRGGYLSRVAIPVGVYACVWTYFCVLYWCVSVPLMNERQL